MASDYSGSIIDPSAKASQGGPIHFFTDHTPNRYCRHPFLNFFLPWDSVA